MLATVLAAVGTTHTVSGLTQPNLASYHAAFLTAAVIALIGSAVALTIRDKDAASTMVLRGRAAERADDHPAAPAPAAT